MTPDSTTETRFATEGFLPVWGIVVVGLGLLALSWWMARRDARFADRPKSVWFLFVLRCVAVLVLLWMLAGPTLVTTVRKFRMKSLALLVDSSASMGLVDVVDGSGNVSRWAAARTDTRDTRHIRELDEAIATLRAAQNQLERFSKLPNITKNTPETHGLLAHSVEGIKAGAAAVTRAADNLPGSTGPEVKRSLGEANRTVVDKVLDVVQVKSTEFSRGKTLASLERERWLPERLTLLTAAIGQMERLAEQFIKSLEEPTVKSPGEIANQESKFSRFDKVESFLAMAEKDWLKEIRNKATVTRYEFGDKVVPLGSVAPSEKKGENTQRSLGASTQLGAALQELALANTAQPVEAAIIITDGGQNAGRDPRELAPSLAGTKVHIVPIGNTKMQRDVILHHTHAPKAVLQNDQVAIDSIITAYDCEQEKLQVELLDNGVVVDQQTLNVTSEVFDSRVQLRWKAARLGKHTLAFRVRPVSDERSEENNAAKADVHVMEDKIRVLVADNYPRWETRYILNLFKRDDRVSFDQLLFEPQISAGEGVRSGFPASLEEWSKYRVIILGDVLPTQLPAEQQRLLRTYVTEAGGNIIIVAGKDAMPGAYMNQPLGSLLPIEAGDRALPDNRAFYLHLTDEGSMTLATQIAENPGISERLWRDMSQRLPIYAMSPFSKPKPTTHSLIWASLNKTSFNPADPTTRSFLAWHYVGAGRVVYLAAPVTYQLRYRQGDTFHHRFWGQLLRWAVARDLAEGSHTVRLSTDKSRYEQGESVQAAVRLRQLDSRPVGGAALILEALQEGKLVQQIALREDASRPGTYHGALEQLPVGPVKLQVSGDLVKSLLAAENYRRPIETTINVDPSGVLELRHPLCNLPLLREIADASGGMIVPPTGLKAALKQLNLDPQVLENVAKKPLWNRWDLFWLFILCLTLEWAGRKYLGLS
ncbi:MAG: hypothetical protein L0Y58_12215 [Verrucomicrobia subdivision 3 bacterium]|nr:hypothetical protein [Limisphaerales bacterium]